MGSLCQDKILLPTLYLLLLHGFWGIHLYLNFQLIPELNVWHFPSNKSICFPTLPGLVSKCLIKIFVSKGPITTEGVCRPSSFYGSFTEFLSSCAISNRSLHHQEPPPSDHPSDPRPTDQDVHPTGGARTCWELKSCAELLLLIVDVL